MHFNPCRARQPVRQSIKRTQIYHILDPKCIQWPYLFAHLPNPTNPKQTRHIFSTRPSTKTPKYSAARSQAGIKLGFLKKRFPRRREKDKNNKANKDGYLFPKGNAMMQYSPVS
jgi:hypothetical protein